MKAIVAQAVSKHATDYDYLHELTEWTGRYGSVAGIPASPHLRVVRRKAD